MLTLWKKCMTGYTTEVVTGDTVEEDMITVLRDTFMMPVQLTMVKRVTTQVCINKIINLTVVVLTGILEIQRI